MGDLMDVSVHSVDGQTTVVANVTHVPNGTNGPFCCVTLAFPKSHENQISFYLPETDLDKARELVGRWNDLSIAQEQL